MGEAGEKARHALKRLLVNGPLTGIPRRSSDQEMLVALAAARFTPGREYGEREVNVAIKAWLDTFCTPYGIDHVTMRRMLVDSRCLVRDPSGATYRVNPARDAAAQQDASIDPAQVLAEIDHERANRKLRRTP